LGGCAGSGKSYISDAVTAFHERYAGPMSMRRVAYAANPAHAIHGTTANSLLHIPIFGTIRTMTLRADKLADLEREFAVLVTFLADEASMISSTFLGQSSWRLNQFCGAAPLHEAKDADPAATDDAPVLGNVNSVLSGDFWQLPDTETHVDHLYSAFRPRKPAQNDTERKRTARAHKDYFSKEGKRAWNAFNAALFCDFSWRHAGDPALFQLLQAMRSGTMTEEQLQQLKARTCGSPGGPRLDKEPFQSAPGVCQRQMERMALNMKEVKAFARRHGQHFILCPAQDSVHGQPLKEPLRTAALRRNPNRSGKSIGILGLTFAMPIVIEGRNKAVSCGFMHNARGFLVGLTLHREDLARMPVDVRCPWVLSHLPELALVYLPGSTLQFGNLPMGVIPIKPEGTSFKMEWNTSKGAEPMDIYRKQLPFGPSFWLTTYGVQGETHGIMLTDLVPGPNAQRHKTLAEMYTSTSRTKTLKGLAILRPFDTNLFRATPPPEMLADTARLYKLFAATIKDLRDDGYFVPENLDVSPPDCVKPCMS
jgi:hypothetical protein